MAKDDDDSLTVSPRALTDAVHQLEREADSAAESKYEMKEVRWEVRAGWWFLSVIFAVVAFLATGMIELRERMTRVETRQEMYKP